MFLTHSFDEDRGTPVSRADPTPPQNSETRELHFTRDLVVVGKVKRMDRQLKGYDRSTGNASLNLEKSEKRP
jgi:hypothetical protein